MPQGSEVHEFQISDETDDPHGVNHDRKGDHDRADQHLPAKHLPHPLPNVNTRHPKALDTDQGLIQVLNGLSCLLSLVRGLTWRQVPRRRARPRLEIVLASSLCSAWGAVQGMEKE